MMRTVAERGKYWYNYSEHLYTWILSILCCCNCCCLKRSNWFDHKLKLMKRHKEASAKLADEIDIVKLLYV